MYTDKHDKESARAEVFRINFLSFSIYRERICARESGERAFLYILLVSVKKQTLDFFGKENAFESVCGGA